MAALVLFALLLAGTSPALAGAHPAQASAPSAFKEVATQACVCQATVHGDSARPSAYRLASAFAPAPVYDEQLGATFTQSFTAMAFNVTAVEQTDASSGDGPAYLLNGLTGAGFWYQVGVSWDWNPGAVPGTGFDMNYEVFNPQQESIFPSDGSGGLQSFSGNVNQGDSVLLNLYFSSGQVMMVAHDWNTGASASENFSAESATSFEGDGMSNSNSNGFFTGLMTEWYHGQPYLSNEKGVIYLESTFAISSAWLWMDEYSPSSNNPHSVFSAVTTSPISFTSDPAKLQEFSSNNATEYMDAHEFLTGAMNATALAAVPLTLSYSVVGGGSGYSAPVLSYVSEGASINANLSTTPSTYNLDKGSAWSVTDTLGGSTAGERWETDQQTASNATTAQTVQLTYYHQYAATVSYAILGAETTGPDFTFTAFGAARSVITSLPSTRLWVDAGTPYGMTGTLTGSNAQERWVSAGSPNGTATSSFMIAPTYYQQFLVSARYSTIGGGNLSSAGEVSISAIAFGKEIATTLTPNAQSLWLDAGSAYGLTKGIGIHGANGTSVTASVEQWIANSTGGTVTEGLAIDAQYQNQYLVTLRPSSTTAGSLSTSGGWYDSGSLLQVTATANSGWQMEYWLPTGGLSGQIASSGDTLSVPVDSPINDTAVFYAGLTISAGAGVPVSYSYPSFITSSIVLQGSVPAGASGVIYVPPSGLKLVAGAPSFPYSFGGWSGASTSSSPSISLAVSGPASIGARSSYNYLDIGIILGAVILFIAIAAGLSSRRPRKTVGSPAA